jgi:hypothetical protein
MWLDEQASGLRRRHPRGNVGERRALRAADHHLGEWQKRECASCG